MWLGLKPKLVTLFVGTLTVTSALGFMSNEYVTWRATMACEAKCQLFGCKSGSLFGQKDGQSQACRCDGEQDYLVIVDQY
jgi:hypothetical protein